MIFVNLHLVFDVCFSDYYDEESDGKLSAPFKMAVTETWTKPPWFNLVGEEYTACRERVAIFDYSSFAKFDIWVSISKAAVFIWGCWFEVILLVQ